MECNKEEAIRARELAEMKMKNGDFDGARKIVLKAQKLYPELENISQLLSICDVHCSAEKSMLGSDKDWYGVLQVEKFSDEMAIKKQYRRLALFLHPDKNRFPGAEAAFKLICEANALLSDPKTKSLYDNKVRAKVRSAPVNPPPHHLNKTYQFNKQYGAGINVPDGFHSMNQHQATRSSFSVSQEVFGTSCPFCCLKHLMPRKFVNTTVRCQKCSKSFIAYEVSAQGVPSGSANGTTVPGVRMESVFKDKGVGYAAKVSEGLKSNRKNSSINSEYGGMEGGACNDNPNTEGNRKNKRKGRRKFSDESSDSFSTSSESDTDVIVEDSSVATNLNTGPTRRSSRKRQNVSYNEGDDDDDDYDLPGSCKRSQGSKLSENYGNMQNDALDKESVKHENQNGLPADADCSKSESKETGTFYTEEILQDKDLDHDKGVEAKGAGGSASNIDVDADEIETDLDSDSISSDDSDGFICQFEDPEFYDFDQDRNGSCFAVDQYWSCYDSVDGMPRFYGKVKKVCASPFEIHIAWLEPKSSDDTQKKWIDKGLPVGCGKFKVGKTQKMSNCLTFSREVHCAKGKRGFLIMHPKREEIWAIFKDWDVSWSSQPKSRREFIYEIVEVLSDFEEKAGARVCYLDKVGGFVSLFQRSSRCMIESFMIRPNELFRFSHCIRYFKMTGSEREGVPVGSFELDPAALPPNPDHLYYPGKSKGVTDNMGSGVNCSPPKSGLEKGSFVKSEISNPNQNVDLE